MRAGNSTDGSDPYAQPNILYQGRTGPDFTEVYPQGGTRKPLVATSRAAAFGDVNNDGGIDVVVVNRDAGVHLLRNRHPQRGHWIRFKVLEKHNRHALGATLRIRVGEQVIRRDVRAAYSYCASNDPRVHLGIGQHLEVSEVEVTWPSGRREVFGPFAADQQFEVREGKGKSPKTPSGPSIR